MSDVQVYGKCSKCGAYAYSPAERCSKCGKYRVQLYRSVDGFFAPRTMDQLSRAPGENADLDAQDEMLRRELNASNISAARSSGCLLLFVAGLAALCWMVCVSIVALNECDSCSASRPYI